MKVRIKSFNGKLPSYLVEGKVYEFEKVGCNGGWLKNDDFDDYIILDGCDHLNGGSWEIVE